MKTCSQKDKTTWEQPEGKRDTVVHGWSALALGSSVSGYV